MKCKHCKQINETPDVVYGENQMYVQCSRCGHKDYHIDIKEVNVCFIPTHASLNFVIKQLQDAAITIGSKLLPYAKVIIRNEYDDDGDQYIRAEVIMRRPYTPEELAEMETQAYKEQQKRQEKLDLYHRLKQELGL